MDATHLTRRHDKRSRSDPAPVRKLDRSLYANVSPIFSIFLMSTCPHCKGHLTDTHRCPRRPLVVGIEVVASAILGGLAGWVLVVAFDPRGQMTDLDTISAIGGAVVAVGLNRALRG